MILRETSGKVAHTSSMLVLGSLSMVAANFAYLSLSFRGLPPRHPLARAAAKPSHRALAGQVALQLGKGTADGIDEHAFWRRGVDRIAEALEPDAALFRLFDQLDELDGPAA
jgi:hypothetical protein